MSVNLSIDGQVTFAQEGITTLKAVKSAGISIPTLCHVNGKHTEHPYKVCAVEHKGRNDLKFSCSEVLKPGMEVFIDSKKVNAFRKERLSVLTGTYSGDCKAPSNHTCPDLTNVHFPYSTASDSGLETTLELSKTNRESANGNTSATNTKCSFSLGYTVSATQTGIQTVIAAKRAAENIHEYHKGCANVPAGNRFLFSREKEITH